MRRHNRAGRGVVGLWAGASTVVLLTAVALVAFATVPAAAQPTPDGGVAAAQARADRAANAYLDAFIRSLQLEAEVAQVEQNIADLEQRVAELRELARGRAVEAYKRSSTPVVTDVADTDEAMDSARRGVLIDLLNARDDNAADQLQEARDDLSAQREDLKAVQQAHADLLARLKADEERLNAELTAAQNERRRAAGSPSADGLTPLPGYVPRAGEHPQHNHPFLVCTRRIESGGNYQAYNSSGPYYGAYQFDQSTWNATANHAGRGELVGMDPRNASEYDQDDMAWTLYQWRGKQPWNGRC